MKLIIGIVILCIIVLIFFYFIPAFRGDTEVRPDFYIGPVRFHFYGIFLALAVLAGFALASKFARQFDLDQKHLENLLIWLVVSGFIGARIYYVVFSWDYFGQRPQDIFAIWKGGLAIYGAIAGGFVGAVFYAKKHRLLFWPIAGVLALALPVSQAIGRLGNFFNQEAFGRPTFLPWKMYVPTELRPEMYLAQTFFHPTFLYELLWNLVVFAALY